MSGELVIEALTVEAIAGRHEQAATVIEETGESLPSSVDGGLATVHVLQILAGVSGTASQFATVSATTAAVVRDTAGDLAGRDSEVASGLRDMTETLR